MKLEILRKAGLSEGEIKIYNALLEAGESSTNKIHEKTGIERRNIYDILNKLIERGFVNYIEENKRKVFRVANPKAIIGYLEEKKEQIEKIEQEVLKEIPEMVKIIESKKKEIHGEIYRGKEGIKSVFEDLLNYKEVHLIGSGEYIASKLPLYFDNWNKRRIKSKVIFHHLFISDLKGKVPERAFQNVKFLPKEFSESPTFIAVFGDRVANFLLGKNLFVFVIESEDLAKNYRKYHSFLWNKVAKK